jgi:uncharacterized Zn finger protein (UPF0148 family)
MSIHYTTEDIAAMPSSTIAQDHDARDEADPQLQDGLHRLAELCSNCGQPLPEVTA